MSGVARQFLVMNEKRRCSILFHFEVPGGRWRMTRVRPISSASFCSSVFHNRLRLLLLPPLSAVTTRRLARGYRAWPPPSPPPPLAFTATAPPAWSIPPL